MLVANKPSWQKSNMPLVYVTTSFHQLHSTYFLSLVHTPVATVQQQRYSTSVTDNSRAMQYIRFLKTPRFSGGTMSALITITSDLGESFMQRDSAVVGTVRRSDDGGAAIARKDFAWKAGMRALRLEIPVRAGAAGGERVVLQVSTSGLAADRLLGPGVAIMAVWSAPVVLRAGEAGEQQQQLVERRLDLGGETLLRVWEERKDSIALHIWYSPRLRTAQCAPRRWVGDGVLTESRDGGVALAAHMAGALSDSGRPDGSRLGALDTLLEGGQRLDVLELGSG